MKIWKYDKYELLEKTTNLTFVTLFLLIPWLIVVLKVSYSTTKGNLPIGSPIETQSDEIMLRSKNISNIIYQNGPKTIQKTTSTKVSPKYAKNNHLDAHVG